MGIFDFITEKELKETLENSMEYIYALINQTIQSDNDLFKEETYRVIILYVISSIEAILLYFYKEHGEKMEYIEYKKIVNLPSEYVNKNKPDLPIIVAVQEKIEKKEYQIGLFDLVNFFKNKGQIQDKTAKDILETNDIRNTFHFNKPRIKKCNIKSVESALKLLVHTVKNGPNSLKRK